MVRSANTDPISAEEYACCYHEWGGSFIVHPEVLKFIEETHGIKTRYRGFIRRGQCVGAVPIWRSFVAGDRWAQIAYRLTKKEDFGYSATYLPIAPQHRCALLYRASYLLSLQQPQIAGALFKGAQKMCILRQIPEELPSGNNQKYYQIKQRRFERRGGTVRDLQEFSGEEIANIYTTLFQQRWRRPPHAADSLVKTFTALRKFLFGKVLWLDSRPIAVQINYRADTSRMIYIDYINGGADKTLKSISPGSLLHYINGFNACEDSRFTGKQLIYSYGIADHEYKG